MRLLLILELEIILLLDLGNSLIQESAPIAPITMFGKLLICTFENNDFKNFHASKTFEDKYLWDRAVAYIIEQAHAVQKFEYVSPGNNKKSIQAINFNMYNTYLEGYWTNREHEAFLVGVKTCGWGRWTDIAKKFVVTRDRIQVASHAYKYLKKTKKLISMEMESEKKDSLWKMKISTILN